MAIRPLLARLVALVRARHHDREFAQELEGHLAMLVDEKVRRGMSRDQAERAARIALGGVESLKARHRDARGFPALESSWQDLRFAVRLTWKERWFSAAAIAALAIGIGANAVGFSIVNAAFFRGLPFPEADRLSKVGWLTHSGRLATVSYPEFEDFRAAARGIDLAAFHETYVNVSDDRSAPERLRGVWVTANTFAVLQQPPLVGRGFTPDDDRPGSALVVIISHAVWMNRYGGDPQVLGKTMRIDGHPATIVGVMPQGMHFDDNARLWAPLIPGDAHQQRAARMLNAFGRLHDGVDRRQARAELDSVADRLRAEHPDATRSFAGAAVTPYEIAGFARTMFATVMVAVVLVLLIACANVANLLLSRSVFRAREVALRIAVGATRARVMRQLLIESLVLAFAGGVLGLALAVSAVDAFEAALWDSEKPYWLVFSVDRTVAGYIAAICLLTTLLFGLAPALHVSKANANDVLKEGGRSNSDARRTRWLSDTMVVAQLALTAVLLAGAGFLLRSFVTLYSLDIGVDTSRLLAAEIELSGEKYPNADARWAMLERLRARVGLLAGVESAALTSRVPPVGGSERVIEVDGASAPESPDVVTVAVSDEFFTVLDRPVVRGRQFGPHDGAPGAEAVIVNQRLAAVFFPAQDPVGRRLRFKAPSAEPGQPLDPWRTIVAVSGPIRQGAPEDAYMSPVAYVPYRQDAPSDATLLVRTALSLDQFTHAVQREVRAEDPDQPVVAVRTVAQLLERDRWPYRIFGSLFAILAVASLALSGVGLYALMAYAVGRRTQEIGMRMAMGASRTQVSWLILRRGLAQLAIGASVGLVGAFLLGAVLERMLVDMTPGDPITIAAVIVVLTTVTVCASLVPASRALRVDPAVALRTE